MLHLVLTSLKRFITQLTQIKLAVCILGYLGNAVLRVANEGLGTQVKYLIDEIVDCGKGSNAIIS